MTRKDYELIATAFAANTPSLDGQAATKAQIASNMATLLVADNPRFDRNKFLKACGLRVTVDGHIIG